MKPKDFQRVALKEDILEENLKAGDIATVVEKIPATSSKQTPGVALEVFDAVGNTKSVVVVSEDKIRSLREDEVLTARKVH